MRQPGVLGWQLGLTLLLVAGGFHVGWMLLSPVPAIATAAGVVAMLAGRCLPDSRGGRVLYASFLAYFLAESFCFVGLYVGALRFFLLLHDVCHLVALALLFRAGLLFLSNTENALDPQCRLVGCAWLVSSGSRECLWRIVAPACFLEGALLSLVPLGLWALNRTHPFLGLPDGVTEADQTIYLAGLSSLSLVLFVLLFLAAVSSGRGRGRAVLPLAPVASAALAYSLFQLLVFLLIPAAAVPVEEFIEFAPLVAIFFVFSGMVLRRLRA